MLSSLPLFKIYTCNKQFLSAVKVNRGRKSSLLRRPKTDIVLSFTQQAEKPGWPNHSYGQGGFGLGHKDSSWLRWFLLAYQRE